MKAFISYSHKDELMLQRLHVHLAHIKREDILKTWTDEEISAGSDLNDSISSNLGGSQLFIALLSPDYIASNYSYDKEFQKAIEMEQNGQLIIIPLIIEPCDWKNTPFSSYKALPKDGKPIVEWQNINTAFLDVTTNLRKLLAGNSITESMISREKTVDISSLPKNYKVKKDFDSIQKMDFIEQSFKEIKNSFKLSLDELILVDENIKYRLIREDDKEIEFILVNRNKINLESNLTVMISANANPIRYSHSEDKGITYSFSKNQRNELNGFNLAFDDFRMFWSESTMFYNRDDKELSTKDIVNKIWVEWLSIVGIIS